MTDSTSDSNCIFCQIVAGKMPCHKIWEDENHLAFLSIFPNTAGFSVIVPKTHYPSYAFEVPDQVLTELILATKKVALLLDASFPDVARCGLFFEGYGVDHLHAKLSPMHGTKNLQPSDSLEAAKPDVFFDRYPGYLSSHDAGRADDAQLAELAARIRAQAKA